MKIFNGLLLVIIAILTCMSILGLITIHWELIANHPFSFSPEGVNRYLTAFATYKELFVVTIATIAAYFGLLRLKAATDANNDKLKQDRFSEWKTVLDIRFIEIEKPDPYMKREFVRIRYRLFQQLHDLNFSITNQEQLEQIFETNLNDLVRTCEEQNNKHLAMGGIYPNNTYAYSFDSFRFLLLGCVDNIYPEIVADLQVLFVARLSPDRFIDNATYQAALRTYRPL